MRILSSTVGLSFAPQVNCQKQSDKCAGKPFNATSPNCLGFGAFVPTGILYVHPISSIQKQVRALGIKASLVDDGSQKNLFLANRLKKCLGKIKDMGFEIPKMELHFDDWDEAFERHSTAAVTDVSWDKKAQKASISMSFNAPLYKYQNDSGQVYRLKKSPADTSFDADFFHEFAHAYQSWVNHENYSKLISQPVPDELKDEICTKVSKYATTNKAEFVAEYFAYKLIGHDIKSKPLEDFYKKCLGPDVDAVFSKSA